MKLTDIHRIRDAGLITEEQSTAIIEHFRLGRETNKLLVILGIIGGVLVGAGVILLIASNWEQIPRLVKLGIALALLVGAHVTGWKLAKDNRHPALSGAFHFLGSLLFLANIALVGQAYHLSSRPSNAILLWLAGVAPLAWILRSKAHHVLALLVFGLWFGIEMNLGDGWLSFDEEARQFMAYAWLGMVFMGLGAVLRKSAYPEFGPSTELLGVLALHICTYPLTIGFYYDSSVIASNSLYVAGALTAVAVALAIWSAARTRQIPDLQWRWVWAGATIGIAGLCWMGLLAREDNVWMGRDRWTGFHWIAAIALFVFCLIQIHVGLLRRNAALVNLAITFIAVHCITAYIQLFGSMKDTGLVFLIGGAFLLGLAFYLERKRRALLKRMNSLPPEPQP